MNVSTKLNVYIAWCVLITASSIDCGTSHPAVYLQQPRTNTKKTRKQLKLDLWKSVVLPVTCTHIQVVDLNELESMIAISFLGHYSTENNVLQNDDLHNTSA